MRGAQEDREKTGTGMPTGLREIGGSIIGKIVALRRRKKSSSFLSESTN